MMILRTLLFLAVFATALLTGYKIGESIDPIEEIIGSRLDATIKPGVTVPDNNQFNLLIINVDDMNRPDAQLESIWLAAHIENSSKVTLIPVFPSPDDPDQNLLLSDSFAFEGDKPSKAFWDVMSKTDFWWKGYLVSDRKVSINLVDALGGIGIHNQHMNGIQAVGSIISWEDDAQIAVNHQKMFLESICNRISTIPSPDLKAISDLMDQEYRSDTRTKLFIADWTAKYVKNEGLTCNFPTFTQTSAHSEILSP